MIPTIEINEKRVAPTWARQEREIIETLNAAVVEVVARYTRSDGEKQRPGLPENVDVIMDPDQSTTHTVNEPWCAIHLSAGTGTILNFTVERCVNKHTYETPWQKSEDGDLLIKWRPAENFR